MANLVGIEAGGTKFFVSLGDQAGNILQRQRVDTTTPDETMPQVLAIMSEYAADAGFDAIGIGCFGPLDPNPESPSYGKITSTPKLTWRDYPIVQAVQAQFSQPIAFDTDVNAALLCESRWGQGRDAKDMIYITVGTGIGAGVLVNGQLLHGTHHTEIGHMRVPRQAEDTYAGCCPYHRDCLEGLASGPSIKERWQVNSALDLPANHPAWKLQINYLSDLLHNLIISFMPEKIVMGGGVMKQQQLFAGLHQQVAASLNGYIEHCSESHLASVIVPASFGDNTGAKGALALALDCLATKL